jgi:ParB family chromosome partitioning protein
MTKATKPTKQTPKSGLGRGLGRGFDALISNDFDKSILLTPGDRIENIAPANIQASPYQPRRHFDEQALAELAASIKRYGVIQPLVVTPAVNGMYTLIAGERRWRASKIAGLATIPAIIRTSAELEQLELALIENVQRVDLSPLEQAVSIERLHEQFSQSYELIATRLGKAPSTINNTVRLLRLPADAQAALIAGTISEGHARSILALKSDAEQQGQLLRLIVKNEWTVRQAERYVTSIKAGITEDTGVKARVDTETPATKALSKRLGTSVAIRRTARGGRLELGFRTDEDLQRLLDFLASLESA